jgi:hypothetical protein
VAQPMRGLSLGTPEEGGPEKRPSVTTPPARVPNYVRVADIAHLGVSGAGVR